MNSSVTAYGQTGSGKSNTMKGSMSIIFQNIIDLNKLKENNYELRLKMAEIYMNKIKDLFNDASQHEHVGGGYAVELLHFILLNL